MILLKQLFSETEINNITDVISYASMIDSAIINKDNVLCVKGSFLMHTSWLKTEKSSLQYAYLDDYENLIMSRGKAHTVKVNYTWDKPSKY